MDMSSTALQQRANPEPAAFKRNLALLEALLKVDMRYARCLGVERISTCG